MKKLTFIILSISIVIFGCQSCNTEDNKLTIDSIQEQNEILLISQTLPVLIYPIMAPPPPSNLSRKLRIIKLEGYEKYKIEFQKQIDTTQFIMYLYDTLIISGKDIIGHLADTSYNGLGKYLLSDNLKRKHIDINKINLKKTANKISIRLLKENPKLKNWNNNEIGFIGFATYSRIIFNQDNTQALFYFQYIKGKLSGDGILIYAEKVKDQWVIISKQQLWVS